MQSYGGGCAVADISCHADAAKAELFGAGDFFLVFAQHIHPTRTPLRRPGDGRREQILPGVFPGAVGKGVYLAAVRALRLRAGQSDRTAVPGPRADAGRGADAIAARRPARGRQQEPRRG